MYPTVSNNVSKKKGRETSWRADTQRIWSMMEKTISVFFGMKKRKRGQFKSVSKWGEKARS